MKIVDLKAYFIALIAVITTTITPENSTHPYDIGLYSLPSKEQPEDAELAKKLTREYALLRTMPTARLDTEIANRIAHATYNMRVAKMQRKVSRLSGSGQLRSLLPGVGGAIGLQLLSHLLATPAQRHSFNTIGMALGGLGGPVTKIFFNARLAHYRRGIKNINTIYQLDDKTLATYINSLEPTIALTSAGLPHPFVSDLAHRIQLPHDARLVIRQALEESFDSPDEQVAFIREGLKKAVERRVLRVYALYRAVLPISGFLWGTFGLSLASYPSSLRDLDTQRAEQNFKEVIRKKNRQIESLEKKIGQFSPRRDRPNSAPLG